MEVGTKFYPVLSFFSDCLHQRIDLFLRQIRTHDSKLQKTIEILWHVSQGHLRYDINQIWSSQSNENLFVNMLEAGLPELIREEDRTPKTNLAVFSGSI